MPTLRKSWAKQLAEQIRLVDGGSVNALASYPF